MTSVSKRRQNCARGKIKSMGDHDEFMERITKTLYYGQLPTLPCLSLPTTEISCSLWSAAQQGRSLRRLHADEAAWIARGACVSPCALVLAILYLERLNSCNPQYLTETSPAHLFLVSLMVGNKFLQDDGEDEETLCSEWAASGGIPLEELKRLELEFLNAIDWNVFVSEEAFEKGLLRLERLVALKQAQLRGFFTYTDLTLACDNAALSELVKQLTSTCVALTLSYLTSLLAFVTSTLVISQAWMPPLQYLATMKASVSLNATVILTPDVKIANTTINEELLTTILEDETILNNKLKCCEKWQQYQQSKYSNKQISEDSVLLNDWPGDSWWSTSATFNWLYQSSMINPLQRWLDKMVDLSKFVRVNVLKSSTHELKCGYPGKRDFHDYQCLKQQLNLSKLSAFALSISDR